MHFLDNEWWKSRWTEAVEEMVMAAAAHWCTQGPDIAFGTTEWFGLEGTFRDHVVQPPCNK